MNLGFNRGVDLPDPNKLLRGRGRGMRHVKVCKPEDIRVEAFKKPMEAAYRLSVG